MRILLIAGAVAVLAAGTLGAQRLLGRSAPAGHPSALVTATVTRRDLVSRERVDGRLGYDKEYDVANQYTPGLSAAQAAALRHAVASAQTAVDDAIAQADTTSQIDAASVASDQTQLSQDQQKLAADASCATARPDPACAVDQQAVTADQARLTKDQDQQQQDQVGGRTRVDQARSTLTQAQDNLAEAESGSPTSGAGAGAGGAGGPGGGAVVTWLPDEGTVVDRGQTLYGVAGRPIPLLAGDQPLGRKLEPGVSGPDVRELEQNLVALGYGRGLRADGTFTGADTAAVSRWQQALDVPVTGVVESGDAVVLPGPARVEQLKTSLGASVGPGAPVLVATSTAQVVNVSLDANLQALVHDGDPVEVTLPNSGKTVSGRVTSVAQVAVPTQPSAPPSSSGTGEPSATVAVTIGLDDPAGGANLDEAPVTVSIISQSVKSALTVPISALLAQQQGGYAVEVVDAGGGTHLVPVQTGLFDDEDSLVQVTGAGLQEGERVAVPTLS